ncbi:Hypothetical protein PAB0686 [Pyrococcus abyssi GE5]|uniref:Uncharacterized protein n=1 Tax=Pyrococcus abyssi (strain GE5 / Orsay) TaxID=272844 RepID=Q9UZW7_PYRAB|nr:Hypothetical protein PAB0686 [Pyrococcus abyssi GE5]CCE70437.1 TPA: hypothetical protein PAB0686 [Pyrococcus abyssi GE5]
MNFLGIVPKVARISIPYAILSLILNYLFNINLSFPYGILLTFPGILAWIYCYLQVSKAYKRGILMKEGCYSIVRHPIYSIWGCFMDSDKRNFFVLLFSIIFKYFYGIFMLVW